MVFRFDFRHTLVFLSGLLSILFIWILLGYNPTLVLGINDISHHLLTLKIGSSSFPFFTPIYDWLWMGGSLVAPNVGHIPIEVFFLSMGFSAADALNLTILFFQTSVFLFSFRIFNSFSNLRKDEIFFSSLSIAFLPTITLRLVYGHSSLYLPILLVLIFFWFILDQEKDLFLLCLATFINYSLFTGPYFQIIFYSALFCFPVLGYYHFSFIRKHFLSLVIFYLIPLSLNLHFIVLIFNYLRSPDIYRTPNSSSLIYSYAKLFPIDLTELLSFSYLNLNKRYFFFLHEIKVFVGLAPLLYFLKTFRSFLQKKFFLFMTFILLLFIFCPPSFEFIFYKIPFLNMFRIPQRALIPIVPLIYFSIFQFSPETSPFLSKSLKSSSISLIGIFLLLIIYFYFSLFVAEIVFVFFSFSYFFIPKINFLKRDNFILFSFFFFFLFLMSEPKLFSEKSNASLVADNGSNGLSRSGLLNSSFYALNTSRAVGINSIFGYSHPIRSYSLLYSELTGLAEIDKLFFPPIPNKLLLENLLFLYRYDSLPLAYSPNKIQSATIPLLKKPTALLSLLKKKELIPYHLVVGNSSVAPPCGDKIILSDEKIINNNYSISFNNMSLKPCPIIVPFNYSSFLHAKMVNGPEIKISGVNFSQMSLDLPPGKGSLLIATDDSFYFKLKLLGSILAFVFSFVFLFVNNQKKLAQ